MVCERLNVNEYSAVVHTGTELLMNNRYVVDFSRLKEWKFRTDLDFFNISSHVF